MGDLTGAFGNRLSSGGGAGIPSVEAIQKERRDDRDGDASFPEGALFLYIENTSVGGNITVNGDIVGPSGVWSSEAKHNAATTKMELIRGVEVVSAGVEYSFKVAYPSTNPVDINLI